MKKLISTVVVATVFFTEKAYAAVDVTSGIEKDEMTTEKIIGIIVILGGLALFVKMIQRASKY